MSAFFSFVAWWGFITVALCSMAFVLYVLVNGIDKICESQRAKGAGELKINLIILLVIASVIITGYIIRNGYR